MEKYKFKFTAETAPIVFSEKPGDNHLFLVSTQIYLNQTLELVRIITLNDVLHRLGMQEIGMEGDRVGWRHIDGDLIDFRIQYNRTEELPTEFVLEPNCKPLFGD